MSEIRFFKYEALPQPGSQHAAKHGSTLALCWVRSGDDEEAERIARQHVSEQGWEVESLEERGLVDPDSDNVGARYLKRDIAQRIYTIYITAPPARPAR